MSAVREIVCDKCRDTWQADTNNLGKPMICGACGHDLQAQLFGRAEKMALGMRDAMKCGDDPIEAALRAL